MERRRGGALCCAPLLSSRVPAPFCAKRRRASRLSPPLAFLALPARAPQCGALGVCAVPLHTGFATHMVFALTFFISGGVYQYMQNWIDRETGLAREVPPWVEQMRKYTSWGAVGIMLLLVPAALVYRAVTGHFVAYPPVVALCAVAEILTMLFLLLNLSTYGISVMGLHLDITLTKVRARSASR